MNAKPATSSQLTVADIEAVAVRVAEIVREHVPVGSTRYVDAAELANVLGVEREWIYAHAADLGALRLGGPKGRLWLDLNEVRRRLTAGRPPSVARNERGGEILTLPATGLRALGSRQRHATTVRGRHHPDGCKRVAWDRRWETSFRAAPRTSPV